MKTGKKILLLVGILLLAFGLTVLQIAHHRGLSFSAGVVNFSRVSGLNYNQQGYTVLAGGEESFAAGEVSALDLNWISGSVSVERYDGRELVVRESCSRVLTEDETARFRLHGGTLSILPCANNARTLPEKQLTVLVPKGLTLKTVESDATSASVTVRALEVSGAIRLDSSSGSLHVEDCRCAALALNSSSGSRHILRTEVSGDAEANGTSGSFNAESLRCASLDVSSTSGSHNISELRCDTLRLTSSSGSKKVSGLDCRAVEVAFTSGSVRLEFAAAPGSVKVAGTSGSVTLCFPKGTGIDLDYDRTSGSLHGDPIRGDIPVEVETTSGSLTIRYEG
ncbi:MAG: DUF4097 family beta strand repeat protein [Oscillospiraceae bacterium]|nr:DUF4097 family beta strand repeat protein [Oscillospiraceae bacterium]